MLGLRIIRNFLRTSLLISIPAIFCFFLLTLIANPQAIKTTVADILENPEKYDGKLVQVEGWVSSLQFNASRVGPYTTFKLSNQLGKAFSVVNLGILPVKEGDFVRVTVRYNRSVRLIWIYSLESPGNG